MLRQQSIYLGLGMSAAFLSLTGCGAAEPTGPTRPVLYVTVLPADAVIAVGSTLQLTATLKDTDGKTYSGRQFTWASESPEVANVSSTGLVTGRSACLATITATVEGRVGRANITVAAGASSTGASVSPGKGCPAR